MVESIYGIQSEPQAILDECKDLLDLLIRHMRDVASSSAVLAECAEAIEARFSALARRACVQPYEAAEGAATSAAATRAQAAMAGDAAPAARAQAAGASDAASVTAAHAQAVTASHAASMARAQAVVMSKMAARLQAVEQDLQVAPPQLWRWWT